MKPSTQTPANLLFATDLHLRAQAFELVAHQLQSHAALLLGGDLLDAPDGCDAMDQLRRLQSLCPNLTSSGKPLLWCDGNHDLLGSPEAFRKLGLPPVGGPTLLTLAGGEVEIHTVPWAGSLHEVQTSSDRPGLFRILLHHSPPTSTQCAIDLGSGQDFGSFDLRDWLEFGGQEHIDLVLSGHVHAPEHWWCLVGRTLCINPGAVCDPENQPTVSIDPFGGSVTLLHKGSPVDQIRFSRRRLI
jgi:Icc-related predicted phosphoesterase